MTRKSVIDKIRKENEAHSIRIKGDKSDKADAFYILMNTQQVFGTKLDTYHGVKNSTLQLLKQAEIKFEIV